MTTDLEDRPMLPLFREYTIDELSKRLKYSEAYLVEIKLGHQAATPRFKHNACGILNRSHEELFGA